MDQLSKEEEEFYLSFCHNLEKLVVDTAGKAEKLGYNSSLESMILTSGLIRLLAIVFVANEQTFNANSDKQKLAYAEYVRSGVLKMMDNHMSPESAIYELNE